MTFCFIVLLFSLQLVRVTIGGICKFNWQCNGTNFANVCDPGHPDHDHGVCSCSPGYIKTGKNCYPGKMSTL